MVVLHIEPGAGPAERLELVEPFVVICGFTGRDADQVATHIEELEKLGVTPPDSTPIFIPVPGALLRSATAPAEVTSRSTSGEAEPVLIRMPGRGDLLSVGSDHTDRALEAVSVEAGKEACPKFLSSVAWPFEEIDGHWDSLELSARINGTPDPVLEGTLAALTHPSELISLLEASLSIPDERPVVLFLGTLAGAQTAPELGQVHHFAAELRDPGTGRALVCAYDIHEPGDGSRLARRTEAAG